MKAVDVIEHLPPYIGDEHGVIKFLEECHRILKPGAELFIQTPGWKAEFLWIDPTHVRGFDIQSMDFFDPTKHYGKTTGFYSKCKFSVKAEELPNHNLRFWLKKI
jgi:SAM-dependent methyltransferase